MADPLSISASIAGLVAIADLIFRSGTKYVKGYKGAQREVESLMREVRDLSVVLHNLELLAFDLEETEPDESFHQGKSSLQLHHLHDCRQLLRRMENGLSLTDSSLKSKSGLERVQSRLKWPFTSTDSKEMIIEIQRYKQIIDTALAADSLAKLNVCLSQQTEIKNKLDEVQQTAEKILDIQVKIALDGKRDRILKDFGKMNPRQEYETNRKLRHGLTGLWLTQGVEFNDWHSTPRARLWCSGIPGGGKSVLAASIIEECLQRNGKDPDKAVAYFFCTYRQPLSQDPRSILSSLCMQLALQNEDAFEILQEAHHELYDGYMNTQPATESLVEVLQQLASCFTRVYIVVDGLDECGDHTEENTATFAQIAATQKDDAINMALLSRNEVVIRHITENDFKHIEIEARTDDVQLYVASELSQRIITRKLRLKDPALKDLIMTRLVEGAKGMFRWVACQVDHMCELPTDKARRQALSKLPPTLFDTYDRILMRVEEYNDEVKQLVRKTLLLLFTSPSISFRELCESISLSEDVDSLEEDEIVSEEDVLRWCSSLVRTKDILDRGSLITTIEFAHFTVREYLHALNTKPIGLQYPQLKQYAIPADHGHVFRTYVYLRFHTMDNLDRKLQACSIAQKISDIVAERRTFETYRKGVCAWTLYMEKGMVVGGQNYQLAQKLLRRKNRLFCLWAVEFIFQIRSDEMKDSGQLLNVSELIRLAVNTVLRPDFTTLHMAAAFYAPDICQELLQNGSSPDVCSNFGSPLHYAVGGWGIFLAHGYASGLRSYPADRVPLTQKVQTIELLLPSKITFQSDMETSFFSGTLLSFTLSSLQRPSLAIKVATLLVGAHVNIGECDVQQFENFYRGVYGFLNLPIASDLLKDLQRFVEVLGDEHEPDTHRSILRQKTVDLINKVPKATAEKPNLGLSQSAGTDEILAHFLSLINLNDKQGLEAFLATGNPGLIKSPGLDPGNPSYTALHLAVRKRSFDLIEPLLAFGLDPQAKAIDDVTPIHLCDEPQSREALENLLRYATSSIDTDSRGETIWHRAAENRAVPVLTLLLSCGEAEVALKMVSKEGKTPLCIVASDQRQHASHSFRILMGYCEENRHFESQEFHRYLANSNTLLTLLHDPAAQHAIETFRKHGTFAKTPDGLRMLARCFQKSMEENVLGDCEKLISLGCPIEFDLEMGLNVTPFGLAIWNNQETMVGWFCTKTTPVSTVFRHPIDNYECTALELILERPQLNHYLPLLVDRYLQEGGDFSHMQFSLLWIPILHTNQDGLLILLEALQGRDLGSEERTIELHEKESGRTLRYTTGARTLDAIVNQCDFVGQTPLHYAAMMDDPGAVKILLDHGAEVDKFDDELETPLYRAVRGGRYEVAGLLIERGAQFDIATESSGDLILLACRKHHWRSATLLLNAGELMTHTTRRGTNLLNLMTSAPPPGGKPDIGLFHRFLDNGVDLYGIDDYGVSAFHNLFLENCPVYLRIVLDRCLQLDLGKLEGWSTDYFHNVEAIGNIISLGVVNLEYRCEDHGTPLEAAISHRHIDAVKYLVWNGASVPSSLSKAKSPVISMTNPDFMIRRWLFIGRHTERKRLLNIAINGEVKLKGWSGIWIAQVPLPFTLRKRRTESTLAYAQKRCFMQGKEEMYMPVRRLAKLHRYKFETTTNHSCQASEETVYI
ncbi:vegetative incompatibility protein het-e-1 [Fusarium flagelliforme]|uniref:Vegetative incompatibility protein het-e-1 n=1 Tax=Fusarium flagelliforme TaxID=2675880 RepID=A0A395MKX9_9HYPO|nr:vegetative incompatibility protein het-e-1 [Fusarium flagelliforme]